LHRNFLPTISFMCVFAYEQSFVTYIIREKPFPSHASLTTFSIWRPTLTSYSREVLMCYSDRIHKCMRSFNILRNVSDIYATFKKDAIRENHCADGRIKLDSHLTTRNRHDPTTQQKNCHTFTYNGIRQRHDTTTTDDTVIQTVLPDGDCFTNCLSSRILVWQNDKIQLKYLL
jgi:hypothetical protein